VHRHRQQVAALLHLLASWLPLNLAARTHCDAQLPAWSNPAHLQPAFRILAPLDVTPARQCELTPGMISPARDGAELARPRRADLP
jgi:hypothetical protein